ncbi:hypothetical protein DFH11DRAFT_1783023, partial [Phellopilus nigrolimitatus]
GRRRRGAHARLARCWLAAGARGAEDAREWFGRACGAAVWRARRGGQNGWKCARHRGYRFLLCRDNLIFTQSAQHPRVKDIASAIYNDIIQLTCDTITYPYLAIPHCPSTILLDKFRRIISSSNYKQRMRGNVHLKNETHQKSVSSLNLHIEGTSASPTSEETLAEFSKYICCSCHRM